MADRWVIGVELPGEHRISITSDAPVPHFVGDAIIVVLPEQPDACFNAAGKVLGVAKPELLSEVAA